MSHLPDHTGRWRQFLANCRTSATNAQPLWPVGRLTRINGLVMEAAGLKLPLGSSCRILPTGGAPVEAEVVGFAGEKLYLMPSDDIYGLSPGAQVVAFETASPPPLVGAPAPFRRRAIDRAKQVPVGEGLLGRVVDGVGRPLDSKGPVYTGQLRPLQSRPTNPMARATIEQPLDVGAPVQAQRIARPFRQIPDPRHAGFRGVERVRQRSMTSGGRRRLMS